MKKIAMCFLLTLFLTQFSFAETIVLKSGQKIEGKILGKTDKKIMIEVKGLSVTCLLADIESIDGQNAHLPPKNESPMYGGLPRTPEEKQADDEFIKTATEGPGGREEGAKAMIMMGWKFFGEGDFKTAMQRFNQAWLLTPDNADVFFGFGHILLQQGQSEKAKEMLDKAELLNPNKAELYYNRGTAYMVKGNSEKAISDFNKAVELNPNFANAYFNLGLLCDDKGDYDKAIFNYTKALEADTKFGSAYNNRAIAYYFRKAYDKSWEDVHRLDALGEKPNPDFLKELKKASRREK
jgi:tetratricopeptide (TPR) repeat protein